MRANRTTLYDHTIAGILARLTHGILLDASERKQVDIERASGVGGPTARRSWLDRLDTWFWKDEMKRREAYLAQSTDIFELEHRMRALEQGSR
jgi:Protein of unknown function (DUF3563)